MDYFEVRMLKKITKKNIQKFLSASGNDFLDKLPKATDLDTKKRKKKRRCK
jgi:hypothetical protein